jgi:DNA-binding NtrC family response regulator
MQVAQNYGKVVSRRMPDPDRTEINVLVVDDDYDDYRTISRLLSKLDGYTVKTTRASSGLAARSGVSTSRYDVVIADYRLGPETGVDVIKSIIRQRPAVAPILITGHLSPDIHKAALNAGAIHCIEKEGLTVKTLEGAIRTAVHTVFWGSPPAAPTQRDERSGWLH